MISKTKLRKEMRSTLYKQKKIRKPISWEMSNFRHALFKVVEQCHRIKDIKFEFDKKHHTTVCFLMFKTQTLVCYDDQSGLVRVKSKSAHKFSAYDTLPIVVKEMQPKIVITKKITKGV